MVAIEHFFEKSKTAVHFFEGGVGCAGLFRTAEYAKTLNLRGLCGFEFAGCRKAFVPAELCTIVAVGWRTGRAK